jgi:hypothetical protein
MNGELGNQGEGDIVGARENGNEDEDEDDDEIVTDLSVTAYVQLASTIRTHLSHFFFVWFQITIY